MKGDRDNIMNLYEEVTNKILKKLEKGIVPWEQNFISLQKGAYNRVSKKQYSLLNQVCLNYSGEYATYKQWTDLGGKIQKGAKGEHIVFWNMKKIIEKNEKDEEVEKFIPILKYHTVFHISQVDGVTSELDNKNDDIEEADETISDYIFKNGIVIDENNNNDEYYDEISKTIHIPLKKQFLTSEDYYHSIFLQCINSTKNELNRNEKDFAEKLIDEIGTMAIMNTLSLNGENIKSKKDNDITTIIDEMKKNSKFIVSVIGKAEKAAKYVMD